MKIPLHDIVNIYEKLINQINVGEISVVLFTALDVDALCTLKILSRLMKTQNIQYKVYPVSTYTQLEQRIEDSKCYQKIKLFFFINCGGLIDLTQKWFAKDSFTFLFDVHKPIHHANVEAENIKIIDDGHSDLEKVPTAYQADLYFNMDEYLMEGLEERALHQRQRNQQSNQNEDDQIIAPKRKRHYDADHHTQKIDRIRKHRALITDKMNSYYGSNFYGFPSSYIGYMMIRDLNKHNNQYLWCAIVGATGSYLQQKIAKDQYDTIVDIYQSDMSKFNNHNREGQQSQVIYQKNSIKRKTDFQFPLLKQWSLYDGILNSPYMIAKLGLWDQSGIHKMHQFINSVGLSLEDAKQLYKYLSKDSVEKVESQIMNYAENSRFNLLDIAFASFCRQVDYCAEFMASDYYYGLTATLQKSPKLKCQTNQLLQHRIDCFWEAYSLIDSKQSLLLQSIQQYKQMSTIVTKQARNLIDRNHIMYGQVFSFVNFLNDTQQRKIFEHPFILIKLAYLLMNMMKEKKKQSYCKPFIASLQSNETSTSLMVGVMGDSKNTFGVKFEKVIEKLNIDVTMNSFMANIMTIPKQTMVKVVRELGEL